MHDAFKQSIVFQKDKDAVLKVKILYHGTNEDMAHNIVDDGFNRSYTVSHRFGRGTYFANGLIAWNHALRKYIPNPTGVILISAIAYTKIGKTHGQDRKPPDGCDLGGSDDSDKPLIAASFADNQALPTHYAEVMFVDTNGIDS